MRRGCGLPCHATSDQGGLNTTYCSISTGNTADPDVLLACQCLLVPALFNGNCCDLQAAYCYLLGQIGDALEVMPGEEFRVALREASKVTFPCCQVQLPFCEPLLYGVTSCMLFMQCCQHTQQSSSAMAIHTSAHQAVFGVSPSTPARETSLELIAVQVSKAARAVACAGGG